MPRRDDVAVWKGASNSDPGGMRDCVDCVRRDVLELKLVEEAIDPDGIEGFVHVEEDCVC
jgi:hypothetical protein